VILTLLAALFAVFAIHRNEIGIYLLCGYALAMALNVFLPHVAATIALRRYAPGTATALLFNLPVCVMLLVAAGREQLVSWWTLERAPRHCGNCRIDSNPLSSWALDRPASSRMNGVRSTTVQTDNKEVTFETIFCGMGTRITYASGSSSPSRARIGPLPCHLLAEEGHSSVLETILLVLSMHFGDGTPLRFIAGGRWIASAATRIRPEQTR
jgi:hypothetical protein